MQVEPASLVYEYLDEVLKINQIMNLTRITDMNEASILHIEDSLSVLQEMNEAPEGLYGDMGSGGGFPGVPLAIQTKRKTVLIDSVKKKMHAVQEILVKLGLTDQITTYSGRIEELAMEQGGHFSVLTARALSSLPSLLELASPLLKQEGELICLKAQIDETEENQAKDIEDITGMRLIQKRSFHLSDETTYRTIIVFEKFKESQITLPRRIGLAQKRPLKK